MAAFSNLDFETAGANPGDAAGWARNVHATAESIADFGGGAGVEGFENGWSSNEHFVFVLTPSNTSTAGYATLHPQPKPAEDFEELWGSNDQFEFGLGGAVAAELGAAGGAENFEQNWSNNQAFSFALGGASPAHFRPGAASAESFEGGWSHNESYKTAFVGVGTDLVAATYSNGIPFEGFELVQPDLAFTADATTDVFSIPAHGLFNGTPVLVLPDPTGALQPPGGLALNTAVYFVVSATTNSLKVAATVGGPPLDVTANGSGFLRVNSAVLWHEVLDI